MTTEEKARAYDMALEAMSDIIPDENGLVHIRPSDIFHELKESEDEKIRNALIRYHQSTLSIDGVKGEDIIAWLEKQGEQKPIAKMPISDELYEHIRNTCACIDDAFSCYSVKGIQDYLAQARVDANIALDMVKQKPTNRVEPKFKVGDTMRTLQEADDGYTDGMPVIVSIDNEYYHCTNELIAIKDQDNYEFPPINMKQKLADKIKPKFHEGDWIVDNNDGEVFQIIKIRDNTYRIICDDGEEFDAPHYQIENDYHFWTIQDAKNGDVLTLEDKNFTTPFVAVYKGLRDNLTFNSHCFIGFNGNFYKGEDGHNVEDVKPATKEQRSFLFQKMKEAGYEWDADKKELKKIEQSELTEFEDAVKDMMNAYRDAIGDDDVTTEEVKTHATYLLSLIPNNPANWSYEDESVLRDIKAAVASYWYEDTENVILDWLESLKKRIKDKI